MQDMLRDTTTVRYANCMASHMAIRTVLCEQVGRGVEILLWGLTPERRLPLRAYHAGFTLRTEFRQLQSKALRSASEWKSASTRSTHSARKSAWVYATVLRLFASDRWGDLHFD